MKNVNVNEWIVNISNTSYKFTKATILNADRAIGHIKRNKKIYKCLVAYIALCMSPLFIDFCKFFIYELIYFLANTPTNILLEELLKVFIHLAKMLMIIIGMFEIVKSCFMTAIKNLTK